MEAMFNFIPAPIALVLMFIGFAALAVGAIRLGYKQYVKQWALELVTIAEDSIMGSGQGAKKKAQVFAALRGLQKISLGKFARHHRCTAASLQRRQLRGLLQLRLQFLQTLAGGGIGIRLARVGPHDQLQAAFQVVDHRQLIALQEHDVGRAQGVGRAAVL